MNNFSIDHAKQSDFESLYALWNQAGLLLMTYEREKYEYENILSHNHDSCFVARHKNGIIGCILGAFNGRRAWVYHLAVNPKWQKKHIGTLLLKTAEHTFLQKGATKLVLNVYQTNSCVVPFYEKQGYMTKTDMILMEKDIYESTQRKEVNI